MLVFAIAIADTTICFWPCRSIRGSRRLSPSLFRTDICLVVGVVTININISIVVGKISFRRRPGGGATITAATGTTTTEASTARKT